MSYAQRVLKSMCYLMVISGVVCIGMAVFAFNGAKASEDGLVAGYAVITGAISLVSLIVAILGIRGANNPAKIKPFIIATAVIIVATLLGLAYAVMKIGMSPDQIGSQIGGVVFQAVGLWAALQIQKQAA